ncbi:MAG TPA: fimbria/pilus outer membrane usher protein [Burkholderiales bacterium]
MLLVIGSLASRTAASADTDPVPPGTPLPMDLAQAQRGVEAEPPLEAIIVTVTVNGAARGTTPILRDRAGRLFVPAADFRSWGLAVPGGAALRLQGIEHVDLGRVADLRASFDEQRIALEIAVAAEKLPRGTIDLRWRYADALRPAQPSAFFNYALLVAGDDSFSSSRTQVTTEVGGRKGDMLLYSSGFYADQAGERGYTRLQTNLTYDQRDSLQRLVGGDFFTPVRELSGAVPMGGVSFSKHYPMDPFFIQYPTLSLNTTAALPSQVEVRVDGNVVARRQVEPGPVDVVNITGYTGARNVQVVVRDAFGREQVIQQPFYFTDSALRQGLHDYSYNFGFLRENYGVSSGDYGKAAFSGFHRYGVSDLLTLGLRAEAREDMVNGGPIGTVLIPGAGVVGAGASVSGGGGTTGYAGSMFYSFIAPRYSVSLNARHFGDEYRMLPSGAPSQTRNFASASAAYSPTGLGTISTSYTVTEPRNQEALHAWSVGYNASFFSGRGILTLGYTRNRGLVEDWTGSAVFRFLFDRDYSAVASTIRAGGTSSQALNWEKIVPVGEGYGFRLGPERVETSAGTATLSNAYGQYNGRYATLQGRYQGSSNDAVTRGVAELSVASGIGYVRDRFFVSRPLTDSFALVKVGDVPGVPVSANGQFMGKTDERGEAVVSPMLSFYDNYLGFEQRAVPLEYGFASSRLVVSPAFRSGSYLAFDVKKIRAAIGRLEQEVRQQRVPIEFRELKVTRAGVEMPAFTGKGGEFYVEALEPGEYVLRVERDPACTATIQVTDMPLQDFGDVLCSPAGR